MRIGIHLAITTLPDVTTINGGAPCVAAQTLIDNPAASAEVSTSGNGDYWFSVTAAHTASQVQIESRTVVGAAARPWVLYSGSCGSLTQLASGTGDGTATAAIVQGQSYKLKLTQTGGAAGLHAAFITAG